MSILTRQDLIDHYGESEVARASGGSDTIDDVSLSKWLAEANGRVMSYLLPNGIDDITALPESSQVSLKKSARLICWYEIWKDGNNPSMKDANDAEIRWLEGVRSHPTMLTGNAVADASKKASSIKMVRA